MMSLTCVLVAVCSCFVSSRRYRTLVKTSETSDLNVGESMQSDINGFQPRINRLDFVIVRERKRRQFASKPPSQKNPIIDREYVPEGYIFNALEKQDTFVDGKLVTRIAFNYEGQIGWLSVAEPKGSEETWEATLNQVSPPPVQQKLFFEVVVSKKRRELVELDSSIVDREPIPRGSILSALQMTVVEVDKQEVARVQFLHKGRVGWLSVMEPSNKYEVLRRVEDVRSVAITFDSLDQEEDIEYDGWEQLAEQGYPSDQWVVIDITGFPESRHPKQALQLIFFVTPRSKLAVPRHPTTQLSNIHPQIQRTINEMTAALPPLKHKAIHSSRPLHQRPTGFNASAIDARSSTCWRVTTFCQEEHGAVCEDGNINGFRPGSCEQVGYPYCVRSGSNMLGDGNLSWIEHWASTGEMACEVLSYVELSDGDAYDVGCGGKSKQVEMKGRVIGDECTDQ